MLGGFAEKSNGGHALNIARPSFGEIHAGAGAAAWVWII